MRDIFEDIFDNEPLDPMEAARRGMRPALRARFYQARRRRRGGRRLRRAARRPAGADAGPAAAGGAGARDRRGAWRRNGRRSATTIDPAAMPLTRLANAIIDRVAARPNRCAAEIERYLGSDLLFYRAADAATAWWRARPRIWDPVLAWARRDASARASCWRKA